MEQMGGKGHILPKASVLPVHADDLALQAVLFPAGTAINTVTASRIQLTYHPAACPKRF